MLKCLTATALMAGIALSVTPIAGAQPREWDIEVYDKCMLRGGDWAECCLISGGDINGEKCVAPPALQAPPGQTRPVITVPYGRNSGTVG